ncbi:MAG: thermonuclease family protein [Phycisphaeraceae bacterium]
MPRRPRRRGPSPTQFARRRQTRRLLIALVVLAGLLGSFFLGRESAEPGAAPRPGDWDRYHGRSFEVVRVIDGDTLDVAAPDGDDPHTRIRLWGVDTPEKALFGDPAEPFADEATELTRRLTLGREVTLRLEEDRLRGHYGRLLAHVELPDGTLLGRRLVAAGLAESDERWKHSHLEAFEQVEARVRKENRGIWAER